jgi:hypothetical protein
MATDIEISMDNQPGELARVGEALGGAGINIEGLCGFGSGGSGTVHVCVNDGAGAKKALEGAGLNVVKSSDALIMGPVQGGSEPGTLGKLARSIAEAGVNVEVLYLATGDRGVMVTSDNAKAEGLLG